MSIKKRTLIKALLLSSVALAALFASAWVFISYQFSHLEAHKELITTALGTMLNRDVTYEKGKAALTIRSGLALQFTNVVIREKDRSADLLNIKTAFFRMDILPLFISRLLLREVILDQPRLSLKRDRTGSLNIADLLTNGQTSKVGLEVRKITIEKGLVSLLDHAASSEGVLTSLTNLDCRFDTPRWGDTSPFSITATVSGNENRGELALKGIFRRASSKKPLAQSFVDVSLRLKGVDIHHYLPYLNNRVPFSQLAGSLDLETEFSGTLLSFTAKGNVSVRNALLGYPQVFRGPLHPQAVHVDYAVTRNAGHLQLDIARFAVDRLAASGRLNIRDMNQADPLLTATAATAIFPLKDVQAYIPRGIIHRDVMNFIDNHIKAGNFWLVEGKLSGRQSQIINMEKQENAGVLSLRAEVNNGVFVVNKTTPAFQEISGGLELKNRRFSLKKITGRFGASPCALEGGISDFALPQPVVYTAEMTLHPARSEVLWLFGKEKFRNINFQGASTLLLSGKGPADNYRISAHWDLTNAKYAYPEIMEKPPGRANRLTAEITLNENAVNVSSFNYELPPVSANGSALYRFTGKKPLFLSVRSKSFDIRKAVSILPVLRKYDPAGTCLIAVSGHGDISDPGSFQWKGKASLNNVSLKAADSVKRIKGLTGKVVFRGSRMETSRFKASIGESSFAGKCEINNLGKPQVSCQFDTPFFRLADAGWQSPEGAVNFEDIKGKIVIADKHIHVDGLALRLGKSRFNLEGDIRDFADPKITASLNTPYLNFADVARLMTLKSFQRKADPVPSRWELTAVVQADAGVFQGVDFTKFKSRFKFTGESVNIETMEAGFFEGKLTGKGKVDILSGGRNQYAANLSLERISLEKIQSFLDMGDRMVTGSLSLTGEVTATGRTADDFKKTAVGKFQIRAEKGVLKKFSVLSKIFSLLNVFQLAKFQLPDMAKGGMPYNSITGGLFLRHGVFSSEDFFLDSDAMQISAVGKVDFLKKELYNTVGVHPLQSLDKIVAKIPVAGWLLTDEKGSLITLHFTVDGNWDDPEVIPIPVRSVAQGTLDIFRRFFQLPEKLITDTGEVILGH